MTHRKDVFQSKVLQRLYPTVPKPLKDPSPPRIVETLAKTPAIKKNSLQNAVSGDGGSTPCVARPDKRVYTVLPPPADYEPASEGSVTLSVPGDINAAQHPADDNTGESSGGQTGPDGEAEDQKKRRRRRKRKPTEQPCGSLAGGANGSLGSRRDHGPVNPGEAPEGLSRNKRRKLKKKRRKEKLFSLGLTPRATALEFTYQRKEEGEEEEEEDKEEEMGEDVVDEDMKRQRTAAEVSDFLRTTVDTYMSDCSLTNRPPLPTAAVEELLSSLANGTVPPSVLTRISSLLDLLQLKETHALDKALEELHHDPSMPPEVTTSVTSLFRYWITEILPMQRDRKTERSATQPQDSQTDRDD